MTEIQNFSAKIVAKDVFKQEAQTLLDLAEALGGEFDQAIELIAKVTGRVIVTGMGKSGHIGAKIAATLASTGTPAFFVHPAEMGHGDLGMLKSDDLVLGLSYSGNTDELKKVLPAIKATGVPLISITGNANSKLAEFSDVVLLTPVKKEACPLDLAPTNSTTAALVMGDALAVAMMKKTGFEAKDFARSHPLGSLGKSFMLVSELMRKEKQVPQVSVDAGFAEVLKEIDGKALGLTLVVNQGGELAGIITDGDLRRAQLEFEAEAFTKNAAQIMSANPKTCTADTLALSALKLMEEYRIADIVVLDGQSKPLGILDLKDFLEADLV